MPTEKNNEIWVEDVLDFWFKELTAKDWFVKNPVLDAKITRRFGELYEQLSRSIPQECEHSAKAALAAIITLDQLPRNMFRNLPKAFATDELALSLAQSSISRKLDDRLPTVQRQFLYLPFEHSENRLVQARSIELFTRLGNADNLRFAIAHKDIIDRFGRFPHRNEVLGRDSTHEELEFLKAPGSSF